MFWIVSEDIALLGTHALGHLPNFFSMVVCRTEFDSMQDGVDFMCRNWLLVD